MAEHVKRAVDQAPPLTAEQRDRIAVLLCGGTSLAPMDQLDRMPPPVKKCALYRHFDKDDRLLYVGISVNPGTRRGDHARHSAFIEFAARETVEWLDDTDAALAAERSAIATEKPLFNKVSAAPDRDRRLVEYLLERGATHLLKAP